MPTPRRDELGRFLRALHRRHVALRAAERTGLGILGGSVVALILLPLLLRQGHDAVAPCASALAAGACLGLLWGVTRRPRPLDAAVEADRQLGLKDLLGTALLVRGGDADSWTRTVLVLAETRCRGLSPSSVILHRVGGRAWGGIGLSVVLVFTLAVFFGTPSDGRAASSRADAVRATGTAPPDRPARPLLAAAASQRPAAVGADNDANDAHPGPSMPVESPEPPGREPAPPAGTKADGPPTGTPAGGPSGGTAGSGQTKPPEPTGHPPEAAGTDKDHVPSPGAGDAARPPAGGAGRAAAGTPSGVAGSAGTAAGGSAGAAGHAAVADGPVARGRPQGAARRWTPAASRPLTATWCGSISSGSEVGGVKVVRGKEDPALRARG